MNTKPISELARRAAIKQLAALCGLALSASSLAIMAEARNSSSKPQGFLNQQQLLLLSQLGEIIIPATETPGAIGADVHSFISRHLYSCVNHEEQQQFVSGLAKIEQASKKLWRKNFLKLSSKKQISLLTDMEKAQGEFDGSDRTFFKQLKGLVLFGYYTSEIGATQELAYLAIPGAFKGDVKFNSVGKAWAL